MVDGVEGCSEVEEDQYVEVPRVCREEEIVCDFQESGFGAVGGIQIGMVRQWVGKLACWVK